MNKFIRGTEIEAFLKKKAISQMNWLTNIVSCF